MFYVYHPIAHISHCDLCENSCAIYTIVDDRGEYVMELCRDCIMRTLEVDVDLLLLGLYSEVINWRIEGF
jgi:hypothetical protein